MNIFKHLLPVVGLRVQDSQKHRELEDDFRQNQAAFRASEEGFFNAFEYAAIGMALVSLKGQWLRVNPALCELIGYSGSELTTKTFQDITHPDDLKADLENVAQLLAGKIPSYRMEKRYLHKEGHEVWGLLSVSLVRDAAGKPLHFISQIQDINETKRATDALKRNETMLSSAQRIAHFGSWEFDLTGPDLDLSPLHWSDEVFRIFGYEPNEIEVSSANFFRAVHPDDRERIREATTSTVRDGKVYYALDHRIILPNGAVRHVHEEAQIFRDPSSGHPYKMIGIVQDITDRKAAEQRVVEQAALIDEARDAIILRDLDHTIRFWNKGAERLYGFTAEEVIGRKATDLIYQSSDIMDQAMRAVLEKGEWMGEVQSITKTRKPLVVDCRWTLLRDPEGRPKSLLSINSDITERKNIESQFLRAQRMESIGTLAGGIAHDLNNLLSPIIMGVDLLKSYGLGGPSSKVVEEIERSAKRGSNLVRQVLSFARGVEGARVAVHIGAVVEELVSMIRNTFPRNITLDVRISRETWLVPGDPTQLNQVLLNLCVNARDAMPEGGRLTITAGNVAIENPGTGLQSGLSPGRYVMVEVTDTGSGIPREKIDKIFDPFYTTKEMGKGTGLGLATTMGIVRSHGGVINVQSEVGRGSTFRLYLPAQVEATILETDDTPRDKWPRGKGEWILVVDDEASILNVTKETLQDFGYQVVTAENGTEATRLFTENPKKISLLLTDMTDGTATVKALRQLDPEIRIIASSGQNGEGHLAKAREAGIRHQLAKPYTTHALLGSIRAALDEKI